MRQDITLKDVQVAKKKFEESLQVLLIGKLVKEFYDETGIRVTDIDIDWSDVSRVTDPHLCYRMVPGKIICEYEEIRI